MAAHLLTRYWSNGMCRRTSPDNAVAQLPIAGTVVPDYLSACRTDGAALDEARRRHKKKMNARLAVARCSTSVGWTVRSHSPATLSFIQMFIKAQGPVCNAESATRCPFVLSRIAGSPVKVHDDDIKIMHAEIWREMSDLALVSSLSCFDYSVGCQ